MERSYIHIFTKKRKKEKKSDVDVHFQTYSLLFQTNKNL